MIQKLRAVAVILLAALPRTRWRSPEADPA